ncbi:tyrosine-type recombinase/integrase, partial [Elizabethkingia anophelis]|uniref:tyrosine-type recombinase/integrase n=1 Tax=Elizabethkingia anophelis TaxID=1117645 RepID=UPI002950076E
MKHKLERYEKSRGKIVLISEVDENFKSDFVDYCKSENYALGTIKRDLVFIKTFCNYAFEKGLEVSRELNKVKIKVKTEIKHPYLTFAELDQIEGKEFNDSLDNVRDWLIVSCYTAQRVSDFMNFKSEMIREENGKYLLEFKQKKTGKLMTIPVHPKVMQVLKK